MISGISTTKVFIPHDQLIWVTGEIITEHTDNIIEVKYDDIELSSQNKTTTKISLDKYNLTALPLQNQDSPIGGVDDMTSLSYLHEPSILDNLRRRFFTESPYTYTGEICIAVNPYKWLDNYSPKLRASYSKDYRKDELPPHVYAATANAYRGLTARNLNQCILVSGESGAGKTETVKILMNHIASVASNSGNLIVDKLLKSNPLLESFGNAKTIRNDNSSRFGKFTQLEFDDFYMLAGSKCTTYLLEKCRVVSQNAGERCYHIMYELLAAPVEVREKVFLGQYNHPADFQYTSNGDTSTNVIEGVFDGARYQQTSQALSLLGVTADTRFMLEQVLAGVLNLGQINFCIDEGNTSSDSVKLGRSPSTPGEVDTDTNDAINAVCSLYGLNPEVFSSAIVCRNIEVEGKKIEVPLTMEQALSGRDAMAKEIYARLFQWLVLVINFSTSAHTGSGLIQTDAPVSATTRLVQSSGAEGYAHPTPSRGNSKRTISLLDIFGFESFVINRFEQLCINYANEKLQQKFAFDVFKTVQREYIEEGIKWDMIKYKDNADVLEMIEGRHSSILVILNEECLIPKGSDLNFLSKITKNFTGHQSFSIPRLSKTEFNVHHYAGVVSYTVAGFLERNKDTLPNNLVDMLMVSNNPLLRRLFVHSTFFCGESADVDRLLAGDRLMNANFLLLDSDSVGVANKENKPAFIDTSSSTPVVLLDALDADQGNTVGTLRDSRRQKRPNSMSVSSELDGFPSIVGSSSSPGEPLSAGGNRNSIGNKRSSTRRRGLSGDGTALPSGGGALSECVTLKFAQSLTSLMDLIATTEVHYVRCIKPNVNKCAIEFCRPLVVEQLRSAGLIEAVRISRAAFPYRIPFAEVFERYQYIRPKSWFASNMSKFEREAAESEYKNINREITLGLMQYVHDIVNSSNKYLKLPVEEMYQFGHSKVYFSSLMMEQLETIRSKAIFDYVTSIQKNYKRLLQRRWFLKTLSTAKHVQAMLRGAIARLKVRTQLESIRKLQTARRTLKLKAAFHIYRKNVIKIQSIIRARLSQKKFIWFRDKMRKLSDLEAAQSIYELEKEQEKEQRRLDELGREQERREQEHLLMQQEEELTRKAQMAELELQRQMKLALEKEEQLRKEQEELILRKQREVEEEIQKQTLLALEKERQMKSQYEQTIANMTHELSIERQKAIEDKQKHEKHMHDSETSFQTTISTLQDQLATALKEIEDLKSQLSNQSVTYKQVLTQQASEYTSLLTSKEALQKSFDIETVRRDLELQQIKAQLEQMSQRVEESKKSLDQERDNNRNEMQRRDEMNLALNTSFQKQMDSTEQREREARAVSERERESSASVINQLRSEFRSSLLEHQQTIEQRDRDASKKLDEEKKRGHAEKSRLEALLQNTQEKLASQLQKYDIDVKTKNKEKEDIISKFTFQQKSMLENQQTLYKDMNEKQKQEMLAAIYEREKIIDDLSTTQDDIMDKLETSMKPTAWLSNTEIIIFIGILILIIAAVSSFDDRFMQLFIKWASKKFLYSNTKHFVQPVARIEM